MFESSFPSNKVSAEIEHVLFNPASFLNILHENLTLISSHI